MGVTEGKAEKTGVKDELDEDGAGKQSERHFLVRERCLKRFEGCSGRL